jgi:hypothetical protein
VEQIRQAIVVAAVFGGCVVNTQEGTPQFLLIVREWLRPGSEAAYNANELRLAAACATLNCPHPYLALVSVDNAREVWWLNAFASGEERDGLDAAYARNERLMAALVPLGKRKEDFREAVSTIRTRYQPDVSSQAGVTIGGARFLVVSATRGQGASGSVFESADGDWFRIASAPTRGVAEEIAVQFGSGAMILAVQPQWSFPAEAWIRADPDLWKSSLIVRPPNA